MRIVLDTNVFVSGVFFTGPPYRILCAWRDGRIQILYSTAILAEYERVGIELCRQFPEVELDSILALVVTQAELIDATPLEGRVCVDPDDDKFLACAISGQCSILVSGDKHLLTQSGYQGIQVLRPRELCDSFQIPPPGASRLRGDVESEELKAVRCPADELGVVVGDE